MNKEPNNKCKELNFAHSWRDITSNIVYMTMPPQYPPKQEQCVNCGLIRTHRQKVEEWFDFEIKELPKSEPITILNGCDLSGNGTVTLNSSNQITYDNK